MIGTLVAMFGFKIGLTNILDKLIKKNRKSFIIFALCLVMIISSILIMYSGIVSMKQDYDKNINIWKFGNVC